MFFVLLFVLHFVLHYLSVYVYSLNISLSLSISSQLLKIYMFSTGFPLFFIAKMSVLKMQTVIKAENILFFTSMRSKRIFTKISLMPEVRNHSSIALQTLKRCYKIYASTLKR